MTPELKKKLHQICKKHKITDLEIPEYGGKPSKFGLFPYSPYIPSNWNRILVLAESQQLRALNEGNEGYRNSLQNANYEDLIFRLGNIKITGQKPEKQIGISPWDEGYIKLAMLACFPESKIEQFGVSNAVPWHLDKDNKTQAALLNRKSIAFWKDILPVLKPEIIICTGVIADSIITDTGYCSNNICHQIHIRSASQLHFVAKKTYPWKDWLDKNPAMKELFENNNDLIKSSIDPKRYFVWYAAHAVSKIQPELNKLK